MSERNSVIHYLHMGVIALGLGYLLVTALTNIEINEPFLLVIMILVFLGRGFDEQEKGHKISSIITYSATVISVLMLLYLLI